MAQTSAPYEPDEASGYTTGSSVRGAAPRTSSTHRCARNRHAMPIHVCNGAVLQCTFGTAPSSLVVLPVNRMLTSGQPAANFMDHVPMVNILPFGTCITPSNPSVAAATAAAQGVLTPMPCLPVTPMPWTPGSPTVLLASMPALNNTSTLMCTWGGVITVAYPGEMTEQIP